MKKLTIVKLFSLLTLAASGAFALGSALNSKKVDAVDAANTKTFYLLRTNGWDDWDTPRIHYWGGDNPTSWDSRPNMVWVRDTYVSGSVTGKLWKYEVPENSTGLLVTKPNSGQTDNYNFASTWGEEEYNGAYLYYDNANKLQPIDLVLVDDGCYLRGDWTDGWSLKGQLKMSGTGPYTISNVDLSGGSAVKMAHVTNGTEDWWGQFHSVSSTDNVRYPVQEIEDENHNVNAGVVSTGTYNITVTYFNNGLWDYEFEGTANVDLDAACTFASNFSTTIKANCPYNYESSSYNDGKSASTLASAWSSEISAYGSLTAVVKSYLTNKDSHVSEITHMFEVYDYVYGHYSSVRNLSGSDFLGRSPTIVNSSNIVGIVSINESTNTIAIIVIISLVSVTAIGGFFFIRKRKEN